MKASAVKVIDREPYVRKSFITLSAASGLTWAQSTNFAVAVAVSVQIEFCASRAAATTTSTVLGFFVRKSVLAMRPLRPHWSLALERSRSRFRPRSFIAFSWDMPTTPQATEPPLSAAIRVPSFPT